MKCRLCQNPDLKLYYTQGNHQQFRFYKCLHCGMVNLDLGTIDTEKNQQKYALKYKNPFDPKANKGALWSFEFIQKHLPAKGSFLDIGCGNGALLHRAKQDGWQVQGLELSPFLAKKINETLDIEVQTANFLDFDNFQQQFDLVALRHVLEHLPDSKAAMNSIARLLKPKGYAMLEFPNIEGLSFQTKRLLGKIGLHKKKYPENYVPGHCNEFSQRSFAFLAHQTGFELVVWQTYSSSPLKNKLMKIFNTATKARVLIRKK